LHQHISPSKHAQTGKASTIKNVVTEEKINCRENQQKLERHRQESLEKKHRATGSSDDGTSLPYEESHISSSMHSYCESKESPSQEKVGITHYVVCCIIQNDIRRHLKIYSPLKNNKIEVV
jgi:hypothetical protein